MTTEEEFEKWLDANSDSWRNATSPFVKHTIVLLQEAYLAATKRTAQRCVEICENLIDDDVKNGRLQDASVLARCAGAIREQFLS